MDNYKVNRETMKSTFTQIVSSDQEKGIAQPPLEKPFPKEAILIDLPEVEKDILRKGNIYDCIMDRKSNRIYRDEELSLEELSFLLKTTAQIKEIKADGYVGLRPVPSAGGRHPFETYLAVNNVKGLVKGIYRYLPLEDKLLLIKEEENIANIVSEGANRQKFVSNAQVTFIWSCIPYRTEWRYAHRSYKIMLLDAGHICHGLYLSCEAIGLGTCAIASYNQEFMDELLGIDGEDEFVVYMSPVGRV